MIAIVLVLLYVMVLEFIGAYYRYFLRKPVLKPESSLPAVTVLVPFRNEKEKLPALISYLLHQRYDGPAPVILLIDDHSTDNYNADIIPAGVQLLKLEGENAGKKYALTKGIEHAETHWIVTTDADTELSPDWLTGLMLHAEDTSSVMVCGRVEVKSNGSLLQDFQSMETRVLQSSGTAAMEAGFAFLNTGASLAFRKDAWLAVNGYDGHIHVPSGDDVFLLFDLERKFPGRITFSSQRSALVRTPAAKDLGALFRQRIRWVGKMRHYRSFSALLIAVIVLGAAIATVIACITGKMTLFVVLLLVRGIAEIRLLNLASNGLLPIRLLSKLWMVLIYPFYLLLLTLGAIVYKPAWKE